MNSLWMGNSRSGIAIIRVSSHRQKDNSPEVQEQVIQAYAQSQGIKIVKIEKIVESAKDSLERVKFRNAIDHAIENGIRHILFYMTDRECRNYTDLETNVRLIKQDKIVLHYAREGRLLWKHSPQSDFLMREFQTLQDKQVSATISIKVNDAQLKKAESGWYPGNHPPLGYVHKKLIDENGREKKRGTVIIKDPNDKAVEQVIREFELRAQGLSYGSIRKKIISEGFIPLRKVASYPISSIERRIHNSFYRGTFVWQGLEYEGKHPLIIPEAILRALDKPLERGQSTFLKHQGTFSGGWLKCACGCYMVYDPKTRENKQTGQKKTHHYYHCTNHKRAHETMKGRNITEEKILEQFAVALDDLKIERPFAAQNCRSAKRGQSQGSGKNHQASRGI